MKTMFDNGFRPGTMFFGSTLAPELGQVRLRGAALGQGDITQAQRDQGLAMITAAQAKYDVVHKWIAAYFDQDPMLTKLLGQYKDNFWSYSDLAEKRQGEADYVFRQFSSDDPASWNMVTAKDLGYVDTDWRLSIDQMYEAIKLVDPSYLVPPVGKKTGAQVTQGPGAKPVPGVPAPKPGTLAVAAPGSTIFGMPQKDVLVGSAVAVGLGIALYAILG